MEYPDEHALHKPVPAAHELQPVMLLLAQHTEFMHSPEVHALLEEQVVPLFTQ